MKIVPDAPVADKPAAPAADKPPLPAQPQTSDRPRAGSRLLAKLRALVIPIAVLLLAVGIVVLITTRWNSWVGGRSTQSTDDAYVRADVTPLSTKISGIVSVVAVEDYQQVKAGDLLVQIKDDDFRAQVEQAEAGVLAAQAALENNHRQKELQSSKIAQAQANVKATGADVERTRLERVREEELEKTGSSTHQKLEQAVADEERLRATLSSRQAEVETQRREVAVLDAQEIQLKADMSAREAAVKLARINLDYTRIVVPTDGIVGERKVRAGQLVSPGTQVISLVGQTVWVVANYKETQLRNVRAGDKADVIVDGVPGVVFTGRVETVSPASGSQFSLLPPDNATGNFTKIAQRIPVKIVLDPKQALTERLRPGMSVIATIKTTP
ncbi:MAG: HlyD family secretion protein [Nitrospirae bacterium]|nr:MAG: HlyD family secretion protein [Nitrospirota bacterium]